MNILIIVPHLNLGGIGKYVQMMSLELASIGHKVVILTTGGELEKGLTDQNISIIKINLDTKRIYSPKVIIAWLKARELVCSNKIDIIHAHKRVGQMLAMLLHLSTGIPTLCTIHGMYKPKRSRKMLPLFGDKIVAVSKSVADQLRNDFSLEREKVVTIRTGLRFREFDYVDRIESDLDKKEFILGCVARLSPEKGHSNLINVFSHLLKKHTNIRLWILGTGKEARRLREESFELKIENKIKFLSAKDCSNIEFYRAIDLYIQPSLEEGLGIAAMEAQYSGLPVIVSGAGGLSELIINGVTGINYMGDSSVLYESLDLLVSNSAQRDEMGGNAKIYAKHHYAISLTVKNLISVYSSMLLK